MILIIDSSLKHFTCTSTARSCFARIWKINSCFLGSIVLTGRELYRVGYMSPEGPNSKVREAGAVPLNAAGLFLLLGMGFVVLRFQTGRFLGDRKIVQKFTHSRVERELEKLQLKTYGSKKVKVRSPGD